MIFADREHAGRLLADAIRAEFPDAGDSGTVVVLGIPRGGVSVAAPVARALGAPLDIVVPRKIRAPGNRELGLGAVAPGVEVLDERLLRSLGVGDDYLAQEIERQQAEILRREHAYRGGRQAPAVGGKTVIIVDDGIATGGTAIAALRWARAQRAARVIMATPVAPRSVRARLAVEADEVIVLQEPENFVAVGQWYADFAEVPDEQVVRELSTEKEHEEP